MAHDSLGNTDPQRGAKDADALQKGEKNFLDKFKGLSNALSNDENGFSNNEGFNTERGHESLAESQQEEDLKDNAGNESSRDEDDLKSDEQNRRFNP